MILTRSALSEVRRQLKTDIQALLTQSGVFGALEADEARELTLLAREKNLAGEENIFWEGDPSDWFYLIHSGKVKVFKSTSNGKEVTLSFFGPGEIFGEVAVLENQPYPASAQAVTATRLIGIRKADFKEYLLKHPALALKIIMVLSGRLREAQSRLRDMAGERVEQRLARLLLRLAAKLGSTLPFTRQELSDMAGTTTETTIRVLSQWKEQGVIRSVRGKIMITDETRLKGLGEGSAPV
jgi:CRP/FNR family transcriptional regulator, nitrogen oxide reductase regulator